jgi:hypothetical protein
MISTIVNLKHKKSPSAVFIVMIVILNSLILFKLNHNYTSPLHYRSFFHQMRMPVSVNLLNPQLRHKNVNGIYVIINTTYMQ